MADQVGQTFVEAIEKLKSTSDQFVPLIVDTLLQHGCQAHASDIHIQPSEQGLELLWRMDGVLQHIHRLPSKLGPNVIARLKVLGDLLTYRNELPQEGRIKHPSISHELRLSTCPTLYGEKAVVRILGNPDELLHVDDLGLPETEQQTLVRLLNETSGAILITGPAGSGKTTTAYACMRHLSRQFRGQRSLVSLEDPIEGALPTVAQSQVKPQIGFDLESGLKSLLRQDPEVILVGEIRDTGTAAGVFQAALTGHLVVSTFHSGSAASSITRLSDMGIEPYLLRSGLLAILHQRLMRRLCECAVWSTDDSARLGLQVTQAKISKGCQTCKGTGYIGRLLVTELLEPAATLLEREILSRGDVQQIESLAIEGGMVSRWDAATSAVRNGETSAAEVRRVLGFGRGLEKKLPTGELPATFVEGL